MGILSEPRLIDFHRGGPILNDIAIIVESIQGQPREH
jgi:hypothetical protein